jgi:CBS domain-containing protein
MSPRVRDLMTSNPITVDVNATAVEAAKVMRDDNVGDVVVTDDGAVNGIVTDRDIVIRGVAAGHDPALTPVGEISSRDLTTVDADADVETAVVLMREKAVRRLPVVDNDQVVGVIAIGDLAQNRDPQSALADISAAAPNN